MKKLLIPMIILVLVLAACGKSDNQKDAKKDMRSYTMDNGKKIEIPKDPKKIAVVAPTYAGGIKKLGGNVVAVNSQVDDSPILKEKFKGVEKIGATGSEDVEKVIKQKPDLIIVYSTDKNIKKYQKVAPTVVFDYAKHKYLDQQIELGKLLGKEDQAKKWADNWKKETAKDGQQIKDKIGKDTTVSLLDEFDKKLYTYGPNWGRGGEVIYQAFGLKMPEKQHELVKKDGFAEIKQEKIPEYAGDYIVSTRDGKAEPSYTQTNLWKNLPAVKDNHVIQVNAKTYWFNDPYTLDYMRKDLKEKFMK